MAGDLPRIVNRYPVTYPLDFNVSNEQPQEGPHVSLYSIMIMHRVTIFSEYITLNFSRYFFKYRQTCQTQKTFDSDYNYIPLYIHVNNNS